jgi:tetratricopeptide (TPR) repeat protein
MATDLRRAAEEHFARGNQFDESGLRDRAIAEWQEAVELDPDHGDAHFNLGIAYAEQGDDDHAIIELREVIRLEPFDTQARRELAEIYLAQDRLDDAVNQLRQTLNLAPGDGAAAHLLAQAYLGAEMWDQAAGALEAGAMLAEDADLWFQLGQAYERARRLDDAILAYRRARVAQADHRDTTRALQRLRVPLEEPPDEAE